MSARLAPQARGAVLLAALVMLVALMLGASALTRLAENTTLLAGNLAYTRAATLAAESCLEASIAWLEHRGPGGLDSDQQAQGYYASDAVHFDPGDNLGGAGPTRVAWTGGPCAGAGLARCLMPAPALPADAAGHTVRYVIQRLCHAPGPHTASGDCAFEPAADINGGSRSGLSYGNNKRLQGAPLGYYRITARASGPRNTVSLIEALVRF
jgi:Tfp pilus assembly protein PilX